MAFDPSNLTPMMQQYLAIRAELPPNTLLFFRLGDFYELFLEDAELASSIMGITLTNRHGMPMAGIPYHSSEPYINKDRKSTRLNSSHIQKSRMPSSA